MSKAAELIAGLSTDAQFDSDGGFSLDRDKAREKMRQFQLADPHRYVLLLVEAAVLSGATRIEFEIDSDDMRMRFDAGLVWADLDELYTSLFVDRTTAAIRARRELALAANAVMALNPRYCVIESVGRDPQTGERAGVRAELRPDVADEISRFEAPPVTRAGGEHDPIDEGEVWTRIHVKERFRPGLLVRFVKLAQDGLPEAQLIERCCALASTAISLDGRRISGGLPRELVAGVAFETDELRGVAGLIGDDEGHRRSAIVFLSNGVELATHELDQGIGRLRFWVDGWGLRKDVSQADVVRSDPAYERALAAVAQARDRVLARLVDLWADGSYFGDETQPSQDQVFDLLRACFLRWADPSWLTPHAGPLGRLAAVPLWRLTTGRWIAPEQLAEALGPAEPPRYSTWDPEGFTPPEWPPTILVAGGSLEREAIERIYPAAVDASERLMMEAPWERARRRWRARTHAIELPAGSCPPTRVVTYEQGEHRGAAVLTLGGRSDVRVVVDGALLSEVELDLGLGFVKLSAVITGPLTPIRSFDRASPDRSFATSLLILLGQMPTLVAALARDEPELVKSCVLALTRPSFAFDWLESFGFAADLATGILARVGAPPLLPELGLVEGQPDNSLTRALRFETVDGREVDLAAIERERQARSGTLAYVARSAEPSSAPMVEFLLWLDGDEQRLLAAVFGANTLDDRTAAYRRDRQRRAFLAKPERSPSPPPTTWTVEIDVEVEGQHIHGYVGVSAGQVRAWTPDRPRTATIEILTQRRLLCTVQVSTWLPGVEASLAWDDAPVNAAYDAVSGGSTQPLLRALERGIVALMRERAEASVGRRPADDERRLLWMGVVSPFVCAELFRAWMVLRREHGDDFEAACAAYFELMQLYPGVPLADLRSAITLLVEEGVAPTASAVIDTFGREPKHESRGRAFHRQLLAIFPVLERVALAMGCGGPVELAGLSASFAETGEIAYVEDASVGWEGERLIVHADAIDNVGLIRLFGADALIEASGWIHEQVHQQRFVAQAPLDALRVEDHKRLVGVEFELEGLRGELAIPTWHPSVGDEAALTMCHERRVIETVNIHAALPIIGLIDDPEAELSADFSKLDTQSSRMAVVRRAVAQVTADQLLPKLAAAYASLDDTGKGIARGWIFSHWMRKSPRAGRFPNRLDEAGRSFAGLPLFRDVDGQARSLDELIERYETHERQLWYVERDPGYALAPPFAIVEARGADLELLEAMFPQVSDFLARWAARVEGEDNKRRAQAMPSAVPSDVLIEVELDRHGLGGRLWLPARYRIVGGVVCGAEGKVVEVLQPVPRLPVCGFIADGLEVDDLFEAVSLTGSQQRYVTARAIYLYASLLSRHERDLARPERPDFLDPDAVEARKLHLTILRDAATSLARARVEGEGFDAILGNFERRVNDCPLLPMDTGRMISVELAREIRPIELAHLGLWDPKLPPVHPRERARLLLGERADPPAAKRAATKLEVQAEAEREAPDHAKVEHGDGPSRGDGDEPGAAVPPLSPEPSDPDPATSEAPDLDLDAIADELRDTQASAAMSSPQDPSTDSPEPAAPAIDPAAELLERVRAELRLLRDHHEVILSEGLLDRIGAEPRKGKILVVIDDGVWFDSTHPRFVRALEDPDPIWVSFLASTAYTALNTWLDKITDAHEIAFHHSHAQFVLSSLLEG